MAQGSDRTTSLARRSVLAQRCRWALGRVRAVLQLWRSGQLSTQQVVRIAARVSRFDRWRPRLRPGTRAAGAPVQGEAQDLGLPHATMGDLRRKIRSLNEQLQQNAALIAHLRRVEAAYTSEAALADRIDEEQLDVLLMELRRSQSSLQRALSPGVAPLPQAGDGERSPSEALAQLQSQALSLESYAGATAGALAGCRRGAAALVRELQAILFETREETEPVKHATTLVRGGRPVREALDTLVNLSEPRHGARAWQYVVPFFAEARPFPLKWPAGLGPLRIVDVGSEALDSEDDIHGHLRRAAPAEIIGFDPFVERGDGVAGPVEVKRPDGTIIRTYGDLLGHGGRTAFYVNRYGPTSSIYPANHGLTRGFGLLDVALEAVETRELPTRTLDDVIRREAGLDRVDFLKIDTQGAAHDVLAGGRETLRRTLICHVELEFAPIYLGESLFAEVDALLRAEGFAFIDFYNLGRQGYASFQRSPLRAYHRGRTLWGDCIYMRGLDDEDRLSVEDLWRAAFVMHVAYNKQDIAAELLARRDRKSGGQSLETYLTGLTGAATARSGGAA